MLEYPCSLSKHRWNAATSHNSMQFELVQKLIVCGAHFAQVTFSNWHAIRVVRGAEKLVSTCTLINIVDENLEVMSN